MPIWKFYNTLMELIMNSGLFNQLLLMFLNEKNKYFTMPASPSSILQSLILHTVLQSHPHTISQSYNLRPDLLDWRQVERRDVRERIDLAFHIMDREYGVTRLLDPEGELSSFHSMENRQRQSICLSL